MVLLTKLEKKILLYAIFISLAFVFIVFNTESLESISNPRNALGFHTIFELFSIAISFAIYTYSWRRYKHTKSSKQLYVAVSFFIVGLLELFHMLSYPGMPYLFGESSLQKTTWFWILARVSEPILLVLILLIPSKCQKKDMRLPLISVGLAYVLGLTTIVYLFNAMLPVLFNEGVGNTLLKNSFEYFISLLHLAAMYITLRLYRTSGQSVYLYLTLACLCMSLSEIVFTMFHSIYDVLNFTGHLYKLLGYYFFLQAVFFQLIDNEQQKENEIQRARQELNLIISEVDGIIFKIKKMEGRFVFTFCNGDILRLLNLRPKELAGKTMGEVIPALNNKLEVYYQEAWEKGHSVEYEIELDSRKYFVSLKPLFLSGKVDELIGSALDITRIKEMEEAIRNNEKLGLLGELAAGIAHEVRNPLTTLKGFLQLLNSDLDEHKKTFVNLMLSEVDRIEIITDEFMTVARPHARPHTHEEVLEVIEQVYKFMQPQALLKGVTMKIEIKSEPEAILCEKNQLKQIFINIIKNSIDAMPAGGNLTIRVEQPNPLEVQIDFIDEGVGIPEDMLEKIGQPFFTSKTGGHGLGLMMSRRIVEQHNGKMEIKSKLGAGTTFSLTFPTGSPGKAAQQENKEIIAI
ncbi:MASE3 domain-containing protein [Bacillus sp. FJAT-18017]|uniref:MASE3 domain-containing protein n=1 Tax=Bacillus sp. FJAT-18017 TaxID=1705566 RepID=UPI0006AF8CF1|nr:MASE3 domain-containing protein [Bacillus sp. FJAT-18017]